MIGLLSGALRFWGGCRFPELGQEFHQFVFGLSWCTYRMNGFFVNFGGVSLESFFYVEG
jgi:hypothetical protein